MAAVTSKKGKGAKERGELSQADYERLAQFRYLLRHFMLFSEDAAENAGLTPQQHQALLAIKGYSGPEPLNTGALAERLAIKHHSAVGLIDRLTAKGLVARRTDSEDRRQVLLELTPRATNLLQGLTLTHRDELKRLAPLLQDLLSALDATS